VDQLPHTIVSESLETLQCINLLLFIIFISSNLHVRPNRSASTVKCCRIKYSSSAVVARSVAVVVVVELSTGRPR
jgi:hypothetical protein